MQRLLALLFAVLLSAAPMAARSPVLSDFVAEASMQSDLLQMLADFATYMKHDFQDCAAPNSIGEACGCFKGEHTMANDERGVRPNADLSMICASPPTSPGQTSSPWP